MSDTPIRDTRRFQTPLLSINWLFWSTMLKCTSAVAERALARRRVRAPPACLKDLGSLSPQPPSDLARFDGTPLVKLLWSNPQGKAQGQGAAAPAWTRGGRFDQSDLTSGVLGFKNV